MPNSLYNPLLTPILFECRTLCITPSDPYFIWTVDSLYNPPSDPYFLWMLDSLYYPPSDHYFVWIPDSQYYPPSDPYFVWILDSLYYPLLTPILSKHWTTSMRMLRTYPYCLTSQPTNLGRSPPVVPTILCNCKCIYNLLFMLHLHKTSL